MKYRKLRIAWSVMWSVLLSALCVLWVRSYEQQDIFNIRYRFGVLFANGSVAVAFGTATEFDLLIERIILTVSTGEPTTPSFHLDDTTARVPLWFCATALFLAAALPWLPRRFSLRTLLIGMTVAAIGLGWIAYALR